jgi:hypothetical protein
VNDDFIQVFSRLLSIYQGKIYGYAGLPDSEYCREVLVKKELKVLVKEIIIQLIEKAK